MTKISVIIPCYKGETFIATIISDIQRQTYKDWELIVVGNGPGQGNQQVIVESLASTDKRIYYFSINDMGVSVARNFGIGKATGEWIVFADADDRVPKNWLQNYHTHMSGNPNMIVGGVCYKDVRSQKTRQVDLNLKSKDGFRSDRATEFLPIFLSDMAAMYSVCSKAYNAEFLKSIGVKFQENLSINEDVIFNLEFAVKCRSMYIIRQTYYVYCTHPESSALGRYHACMETSLKLRHQLIAKILNRAAYKPAETEKILALQYSADALDILLNTYREGSPVGFMAKNKLAKSLFSDTKLRNALKTICPPVSNKPLVAFWLFNKFHAHILCVATFSLLWNLRKAKIYIYSALKYSAKKRS